MKKSDLKTGMVVEIEDGEKGKVLLNTERGDIVGAVNNGDKETWFPLNRFNEDLIEKDNYCGRRIMKVYAMELGNLFAASIKKHGVLIWERKPEYTKDDLVKMIGHEFEIKEK